MRHSQRNIGRLSAALMLGAALMLAGCNETHAERGWDIPTDPQEKAAYDYAHSLKLPDSVPKPVPFDFTLAQVKALWPWNPSVSVQYFQHLCGTEAGEYIFKTVDKVEGLYQMRPMPKRSDELLRDRYGFEDPVDWHPWESEKSPTEFVSAPFRTFSYFESIQSPTRITAPIWTRDWVIKDSDTQTNSLYWRYSNFVQNEQPMVAEPIQQISARYAYTWRGIKRERDREFGIAGGELIVLDRLSGEILGVRRSFAISKQYSNHMDWEFAYFCPLRTDDAGKVSARKSDFTYFFVSKVLKPQRAERNLTQRGK